MGIEIQACSQSESPSRLSQVRCIYPNSRDVPFLIHSLFRLEKYSWRRFRAGSFLEYHWKFF